MNILITGADGFIGRRLVKSLGKGHNLFYLVFKRRGFSAKNKIEIDLTDCRQIKLFFTRFAKKNKIDIIIHLAAKMASGDNANDIGLFYYNIKLAESVAIMAGLLKPKKIINFSSIAVYPGKSGIYTEDSMIRTAENPDCFYGLAKFCGENILDFLLRDKGILISHLRVANVYGRRMREDRIIPAMLSELRNDNNITIFGGGERVANFVSVDKLPNIVKLFMKKDLPGIFNVGGENLSFLELAQGLIREKGDRNSKIIKKQKGSRARWYLDMSKLKSFCGEL